MNIKKILEANKGCRNILIEDEEPDEPTGEEAVEDTAWVFIEHNYNPMDWTDTFLKADTNVVLGLIKNQIGEDDLEYAKSVYDKLMQWATRGKGEE